MKNKVKFKRYFFSGVFVSLFLTILFIFINIFEYRVYTVNFNKKINDMASFILDKYPNISRDDLMTIINNSSSSENVLKEYSIDLDKDSILLENDINFKCFLIFNILFLIAGFLIVLFIFIRYKRSIDKDIRDITSLIEEINKRNYKLNIDSISEDELSILKNEIYKTTIILKEAADNSLNDKVNLKKSLEDISHQLKTPLTGILIMLDNIIEDSEMNSKVRNDFITDIKRNVININFLVQSILKLSKLDTNTVTFIKKMTPLKNIISESIKNVESLCDLKNIEIKVLNDIDGEVNCDSFWQIEAITNVIKNAVEHAEKIVKIETENNKVYFKIRIINDGLGIDKKDINHIFERFYKGKNASSDSIGIGLALSKTIIEQDNGSIGVESNSNETIFTIKYFKD